MDSTLRGRIRQHPWAITALVAAICIASGALAVYASWTGQPRQIFGFEAPPPAELAPGVAIAGSASFDRDSYAIGAPVIFRVRLLYRRDLVEPDLDSFKRSINLSPFERRAVTERQQTLAGGVTEYVLEYAMQGVSVEPHGTYQMNPLVVYYTSEKGRGAGVQTLRIPPRAVHIGGYYPADVSAIPLQEQKGEIRDYPRARQAVTGVSGVVLLATAGFLLWRAGRRRPDAELSHAERLWRTFHDVPRGSMSSRAYLVSCELIFTQLLHARTAVSPRAFWSGVNPQEPAWAEAAATARVLFSRAYRPDPPLDDDVARSAALLDELFSSTVAEERLRREQSPSTLYRLKQQPAILGVSGALIGFAAFMLVLSARPDMWFSDRLARYNLAVRLAEERPRVMEAAEEFSAIGESLEDGIVKAAALYNSATLRATLSLAAGPAERQEELNTVLFQPGRSLYEMFHELDEGQRVETVDMLSRRAEALGNAEVDLKTAIRANPQDEDIGRNLEIVIKHRKAVHDSLVEFLAGQEGAFAPGEGRESADELAESLIDVLKMMQLPAEHVEDAGKDDTGYHVRERF